MERTLQNLFKLSHKVSLFVPTRDRNGAPLAVELITEMVDKVAGEFSIVNGGATSTEAVGYWKTNNSQLIKEKVIVIYSFTNVLEEAIDKAVELAQELKITANQEQVGIEVNNEMYYI
jgi:hypothetical protein